MDSLLNWYSAESVSAIHHALRSSRRRLTVIIVADQAFESFPHPLSGDKCRSDTQMERNEIAVTVRELAREITAIEQGVPIKRATGEPYHNVYTSLIQSHLPRLAAVGAINYDPDRKILHPDDNLLPLVIVTAATSPCQILFHSAAADLYSGGRTTYSITD